VSDSDSRGRWHRRWREPSGWRSQMPLLIALVLLWLMLWGDLSWANLLSGIVIALVLTRVFYLPPAELSGRFNPYWAGAFLLGFFADLARSSWQVARLAFSFGHTPHNAVIAVRLHTSSDLMLTITGNTLTLIPGSSLIDIDRLNRTLYVHLLDADDDEAIERDRQHILTTEKRLIRAIGSREENASLEADRTSGEVRQDGGAHR
jgi:multicomponent Na+:H+ antiporter subunit E